MIIEIPCGNIESVVAASNGGADRIELCSALSLGGLTPTIGMLEEIAGIPIIKFVMIRPREGDFIYSTEEFRVMLRDIELFKRAGAEGIVSGVLMKNGEIDSERTQTLLEAARPLPFTFHRAFDLTPDPFRSLNALIEMKVDRLLTSGQATDAFSGRELIARLVLHSENKLIIVAGAGINRENIKSICETGVSEIHLSCRRKKISETILYHAGVRMGNSSNENFYDVADADIIRSIRELA